MKAEHTPGPWEVDHTSDANQMAACLSEGVGTNREWVAVDSGDDGGHVAYCHPINASLIAAAPELLRALYEAQAAVTYLLSNEDNGGAYNALEAIEAAIANAERRS
jgi:hypothetical protein